MLLRKSYAALAVSAIALLAFSGTAAAHERVQVADGKYELIVGYRTEPPYAGLVNGLDLGVERLVPAHDDDHDDDGHDHGHGASGGVQRVPVTGLLGNLTVTYEIAGQTFTPPDWRGQHGRPGWYTAEITPTREGVYTVHIVGDLEGHPIDVRVRPHAVEPMTPTMFPAKDLTSEETSEKIADLERIVADLRAEVASLRASAQSDSPPAPTERSATPAPGLLVVGLAVLGAALLARKTR